MEMCCQKGFTKSMRAALAISTLLSNFAAIKLIQVCSIQPYTFPATLFTSFSRAMMSSQITPAGQKVQVHKYWEMVFYEDNGVGADRYARVFYGSLESSSFFKVQALST